MSQRFCDSTGRDWYISITVSSAKFINLETGVNIYDAANGQLFSSLATNPSLLADVLFVACRKQATERGITDEQFGELLAGDVIEDATKALTEAIIDFFPKRQREPLAMIAKKINQVQDRAATQMLAAINSPDIDQAIDRALSGQSGSLPDSLDATRPN